jgi:hypothetical protein
VVYTIPQIQELLNSQLSTYRYETVVNHESLRVKWDGLSHERRMRKSKRKTTAKVNQWRNT